ncbi:MAG: hypothetical protein PHZ04_02025 [Patescibacteria group bacterium]|nr:hypothetical protein [Patescibacteria group bacterium]MDD5555001.1 hypothetical protein [Patescibacteria group bacterium]
MNREKPKNIEGNLEDLEIREKISDILEIIRNDRDYNPEDIDEEEIISTIVDQFKAIEKNHIAKESFLLTLEQKIKIMIVKKTEARIREKFSKTIREANEIEKKIHGGDGDIPKIPQAA